MINRKLKRNLSEQRKRATCIDMLNQTLKKTQKILSFNVALINDISKDADPEKIAADIINISKSVSEENGSNVIVSGLVPRKWHLNTKERNINNRLRDYSRNCTLNFLKHGNINAKTPCNISGLHLNKKGVPLFNKNFVSLLNTLDSEI